MFDFGKLFSEIIQAVRLLFGLYDKSKVAEVKVLQSSAPVSSSVPIVQTQLSTLKLNTDTEVKSQVQQIEAVTNMTILYPTPAKAKEARIRDFLDLIVDQVLSQGYKDNENWELNLIHPEFAPYLLTQGAGIASEYTEQKIQRLNKEKGYLYAEWYTYQALSAQWRKAFAKLVLEAGQPTQISTTSDGLYGAINRATLHELWRQTVWTDRKFSDEWLLYARRTDAELDEFLLTLATDDVQFLPKTDKPMG